MHFLFVLHEHQVDSRERELVAATDAAGAAGGRVSAAESEIVRLKEALRVSEARAAAAHTEAGGLRSQLQVRGTSGLWTSGIYPLHPNLIFTTSMFTGPLLTFDALAFDLLPPDCTVLSAAGFPEGRGQPARSGSEGRPDRPFDPQAPGGVKQGGVAQAAGGRHDRASCQGRNGG